MPAARPCRTCRCGRVQIERQASLPRSLIVSRVVIAAYRPRPGKRAALLGMIEKHWHVLDEQGLVTSRQRVVMQAADGTVIEVFEWKSALAMEQAHGNPAVLQLWSGFEAVCEYVPLGSVAEAGQVFADFSPLFN